MIISTLKCQAYIAFMLLLILSTFCCARTNSSDGNMPWNLGSARTAGSMCFNIQYIDSSSLTNFLPQNSFAITTYNYSTFSSSRTVCSP